jgi:two-component system cell cycle sensor histidine kinase/response regulator CckA
MNPEHYDVTPGLAEIEEGHALRRHAEERLQSMPAQAVPDSRAAIDALLHELRVHQIELEMQNESLREIQEKLEISRARYFELYNLAPVCFFNLDRDGAILEANRAATLLLGITRERLLFHSFTKYILHEDQDVFYLSRRLLLESRVSQEFELRLKHKSGVPIWASIYAEVTEDPAGAFVIRAVVTDITVRKQAEDRLHLLGTALESTTNAIVITDTHGSIEWVNGAFRTLTGYSTEECLGQNPRDLLKSGVQDDAFYKDLWDTILEGKVWQGELVNRRKDGTHYYELLTITPVHNRDGVISHFVDIKIDISERKRLEQELLQAQKMESVGRLAGGVAHDFNNLLTVISGFTDLALSDLKEGDNLYKDLTQVMKATQRASALTRQLLAFSRREVLLPEILNVDEVVDGCVEMLRHLVGENFALEILPARGKGMVLADPGQMEQVIMNLVLNARDAMPMGGRILIETTNDVIEQNMMVGHTAVSPGKYVCLSVIDTGLGMDSAMQDHIFEPFFTTKSMGAGTGIGLATVYGIVRQSGGHVAVLSTLGKGSTFKIYLPSVEESALSTMAPAAAAIQCGHENILIVEDEPALRVLTDRILSHAGYSTILALDGEDALLRMEQQPVPVDLVLTDMRMPGMSGQELVEKLNALYPGVKTLYMSGYTDTALASQGIVDNTTHLLAKPFTAEQLTAKIRAVLDAK